MTDTPTPPPPPADTEIVVLLAPSGAPHHWPTGTVARLAATPAAALVAAKRARPATDDDVAIAGGQFRTLV